MTRRHTAAITTLTLSLGLGLFMPAAAAAQVYQVESNQAFGLHLGGFFVRGEDARVEGDVLFADLDSLAFEVKDFNGITFGGEWLFGLTDFVEGAVGAGIYQRTVPSVYRSFTRDDGSEIEQDLRLRIIPLTATVRFLPLGRGSVQPYVGGGFGLFNWRYSEAGEFVDFDQRGLIFRNRYVANGNSFGPVILGGVRAPIGDVWMIGGELRYQNAKGDIDPDIGLLGDRIDLSGWSTSFTVHLRF